MTTDLDKANQPELVVQDSDNVDEEEFEFFTSDMALPSLETMTEEKVLKTVTDVFRGFDQAGTNAAQMFKTLGSLAQYVQSTFEDIQHISQSAELNYLWHRAAFTARCWYLGETINKAMANGSYGASAAPNLATALKKSVTWIYQMRAIATKLTVTECFLLGMRGINSSYLRKLSTIKDDVTRKTLVTAFIEQFKSTSSLDGLEAAKKRLDVAIKAARTGDVIDVSSSDPNAPELQADTSEYTAVVSQMHIWQKMMTRPGKEDVIEDLCQSLSDFYMMKDAPNAEAKLIDVKAEAERTKKLMMTVRNNIDDAIRELDSIQGVALLTEAETKSDETSQQS